MASVLVLFGFSVILLSSIAACTEWADMGNLAPRVGIFLEFEKDPPQSAIQAMEREAGAMLAATGAQFSWLMLKKDEQSATFDELAVLRFRGNCRMEKVGKPEEVTGEALTLGYTNVESGRVFGYSRVECDQIKTFIGSLLENSCAHDRETAFSRALGRVVAHELYHILARTTEHSHEGLAKAIQTPFDLIRENFHFDRRALLWLRQRLQARRDRAREPDPERGIPAV
jgi:hypothetical protein